MKCSLGLAVRFGAIFILVYLTFAILITREIARARLVKDLTSEGLPSLLMNPSVPTGKLALRANKSNSFSLSESRMWHTADSAIPPVPSLRYAPEASSATDDLQRFLTTTSLLSVGATKPTKVVPSLFQALMFARGHRPSVPLANYTHENLLRAGQMTDPQKFCYAQLVDIYDLVNLTDCENVVGVWHCRNSAFSHKMSYCLAYNVSFTKGQVAKLNSSLDLCPVHDNGSRHTGVERKFCLSNDEAVPLSSCKEFVDLAYFYTVNSVHIYFKVLCYYSIFETLLRNGHSIDKVRFYRSVELTNWPNMFAEFEEKMFGKVENFANASDVCVREAHLVPNGFSTNPFRCKMAADKMGHRCNHCDGGRWPVHAVHLFKTFILKHCDVRGSPSWAQDLRIVFILRTPYNRFPGDKESEFSRILLNSNQVINSLRNLTRVNVTAISMEKLDFCDQVRLAWETDILIAVHGSALVHLWWTHAFAEVIEIEPRKQKSNPTFRMLATLTNTRYSAYSIQEIKDTHVALGRDFINFVEDRVHKLRKVRMENGTYDGVPSLVIGKLPLPADIIYDQV